MRKALLLATSLILAAPLTSAAETGDTESLAAHAAVDRYFAAYRAMDLESMLGAFSSDAVFVDVVQRHRYEGAQGLRELLGRLVSMHTTMDVDIRRRAVSGSVVAVDYVYRGTLSGEALRAVSGKTTCQDTDYEIPVTSWFEIAGDRIRTQTDFIDLATLEDVRARALGEPTS